MTRILPKLPQDQSSPCYAHDWKSRNGARLTRTVVSLVLQILKVCVSILNKYINHSHLPIIYTSRRLMHCVGIVPVPNLYHTGSNEPLIP